MKENSIEENIKLLEKLDYLLDDVYSTCLINDEERNEYQYAIEHILSEYKRILKENEELKNEVMEKDLELIGKEEYTKASMGEIIEHYYTANEDCIPTSVIQNKIDELNRRIDYLNTELNKCYIEREKLGTETDIDNNETVIFYMEQEREYRYEQKQVLEEILEEGRNNNEII